MAARLTDGLPALRSPFVLAPLAGVTDAAFRRICFAHGAALAYTEMVSAKGLYYKNENTEDLLRIAPGEGPVVVQLFGSEPDMIAFAADHLRLRPNVALDLNMGCPVPKVVKNGEGSALLKDPQRAASLVRAAAEKARKPVTVKMRIGFSGREGEPDPVDFALAMQEAGAAAIAVHGRTREQYYSGRADWNAIRRIREAVSVPVIGNGDVFSAEDALRMLEETGCDLVMIARGALGDPWIFSECEALWRGQALPPRPDAGEICETVRQHLLLSIADKGEYAAVREMRKHAAWYTKGLKGAADVRRRASQAETADELMNIVERIKEL